MRAVLNSDAIVRVRIDDETGRLIDADAPPTVAVLDGSGTQILTGTATSDGVGIYKYTVASQTRPDHLVVRFTATVGGSVRVIDQHVDIVGARLVELWRLREDAELAGLPLVAMQRLVDATEEWFRSALRFPYTVESQRTSFWYQGGSRLSVPGAPFPIQLYELSSAGIPYTAGEISTVGVDRSAFVYPQTGVYYDPVYGSYAGLFRGGLTKIYCAHGGLPDWGGLIPEDLVRAAFIFARYLNRGSGGTAYPERATQVATEGAVITFSTPSPTRPTGLPEVDAVITRYGLGAIL